MLKIGTKQAGQLWIGPKQVRTLYYGPKLAWMKNAFNSCFGAGFWVRERPWSRSDAWKH